MKANKRFKIIGLQGDLYVWVLNLFNRANATNPVYSSTGSPTTSGWLNTDEGREFVARFGQLGADKYELKEKSPFNFETPRQVRFGLALSF